MSGNVRSHSKRCFFAPKTTAVEEHNNNNTNRLGKLTKLEKKKIKKGQMSWLAIE